MEPAGLCGRCTGVAVPLRVVPSSTGLPSLKGPLRPGYLRRDPAPTPRPEGECVRVCAKITAGGDCSHELKRCLLLGRNVMTNLDRIFKSRDITLPTKVRLVKAMVFPVVMYGCQSWTVKKAERRRIDAFELWCWRRLLRVPWTAEDEMAGWHH